MPRIITRLSIRSVLLAGFALLVAVAPAEAAFPGANGKIAFDSNRSGNWEIYTMSPDGSGVARLTNNPARDVAPAWSPDGTKIAFMSNRDDPNPDTCYGPSSSCNWEIYTMNADGTGQTRITNNPAEDQTPAWSPDGAEIVFTSDRGTPRFFDVYKMNADGSGVTNLTSAAGARDIWPAWSPDGTKIAFSSDRDALGISYDLYTMNADGTGVTHLTTDPRWIEGAANWSPDGTKIAFHGQSPTNGNFQIYTMNPDGSGVARLTNNLANDQEPAWSPDGTKIVFDRREFSAYFEVHTMVADGTGVTNLTGSQNTEIYPSYPDWQPLQTYPRPKAATPLYASLVPAYTTCATPNRTHAPPLNYGSCNPPSQTSGHLTVGTVDANGQAEQSVGSVRLVALPGNPSTPADEADARIDTSITDVRRKVGLADYNGELSTVLHVRLTDRTSGFAQTVQDFPFNVTIPCTVTPDPAIGANCSLSHDRRHGPAGRRSRGQALDLGARQGRGLRRRPGRPRLDDHRQHAVRDPGGVRAVSDTRPFGYWEGETVHSGARPLT